MAGREKAPRVRFAAWFNTVLPSGIAYEQYNSMSPICNHIPAPRSRAEQNRRVEWNPRGMRIV